MTNFNTMTPIEAVFREYSFAPFTRLTDVGGGLGSLTAAVLGTQPHLTATLFDLPKVVEQSKQVRGGCGCVWVYACLGEGGEGGGGRGGARVGRACARWWRSPRR
jgi:hypothetical protein